MEELKINDYVRKLTRPYGYAVVKNPNYDTDKYGTWVECEEILKKHIEKNKWWKSDGTFHERRENLIKIGEAKDTV